MAEIDNLQIKIEYDVSDSVKNVKKLTDALHTLSKATESFSAIKTDGVQKLTNVVRAFSDLAKADVGGAEKFGASVRKLGEALSELSKSTRAFSSEKSYSMKNMASITRMFERLANVDVSGAGKLAASARQITNINWKTVFGSFANINVKNIRNLQQAFTALAGAATQAQRVMRVAQNASAQANRTPQPAQPTAQPAQTTARTTTQSNAAQTNTATQSTSVLSQALKACKKSASGLFGVLKKIGSIGGKVFSGIAKALKGVVSGLKHSNKHSNTFLTKLKQIVSRSIVWKGLQAVTRGASEGLKNLARASTEANAAMSELSTMSLYMKNSFGASLYPAIQLIINALRALVSAVASAMNAINQLLSALGGKSTFVKAKVYAKDYADELESAGGSAKKLKNELMGFDEINQFSPDNSGGGGGGSSDDYSSMFETVEIDKDILDAVKLNDFTALGRSIAGKINGALDKINWDGIKEKAARLANGIATGINGFADEINPQSLADTISGALSTAFEFVNVVVSTTDTKRIGAKIRFTIVKAISQINKDGLATTVGNVISSAIGFIKGITLTPEDQLTVGQKIADALNGLAETVPLGELVDSIGELLGGMLGTMEVIIEETDFEKLGETIGEALSGVAEHLPELAGKLVTVASKFAGGLIRGIKTYFEDNNTSLLSEVAEIVGRFLGSIELDGEVTVTLLKVALAYAGVKLVGAGLKAAGSNIATVLGLGSGHIGGTGTLKLLGTLGFALSAVLETVECVNDAKAGDTKAAVENAIQAVLSAIGAVVAFAGSGVGLVVTLSLKTIVKLLFDEQARQKAMDASVMPVVGKYPVQIKTDQSLIANKDELYTTGKKTLVGTENYLSSETLPELYTTNSETGERELISLPEFNQASSDAITRQVRNALKASKTAYADYTRDLIFGETEWNNYKASLGTVNIKFGELAESTDEFKEFLAVTENPQTEGLQSMRNEIEQLVSSYESLTTLDSDEMFSKFGDSKQTERLDQIDELYNQIQTSIQAYNTAAASIKTDALDESTEAIDSLATAAETATDGIEACKEATDTIAQSMESVSDSTFAPLAVSAAESAEEVEELKQIIIEVPTEKVIKFTANTEEFGEQLETMLEKVSAVAGEKGIEFTVRNSAAVTSQLASIRGTINAIPSSKTLRIHVMLTNDAKKFLESLNVLLKSTKITTGQIQAVIATSSVIAKYTQGGFPSSGDLFIANENGRQEMVGRIGNRSAVANQDQIGDAIFKYMDAHDRQTGGNNTEALASAIVRGLKQAGIGAVYLDGRMLASSINRETQRTGKPAITF